MAVPLSPGVRYHRDGGHTVRLELTGPVDPASVGRAIRDVAAEGPGVLLMDLRRIASVDPASLTRVLDALRAVRRDGVTVAVMPGATTVRRVLGSAAAGRRDR